MKKFLLYAVLVMVCMPLVLLTFLRIRYGGGEHFPDRSGTPAYPFSKMEKVVDLPLPPGNIAVSKTGRIFFTYHPEGKPAQNVMELKNGTPVPYPNAEYQIPGQGRPFFESVLSVRIDLQDRLWTLDFANHGTGTPRLLAFDLKTNKQIHEFIFPAAIAPLGSMLNDFNVDPEGKFIYIADASVFALTGAIIVYDIEKQKARRLLESHPSVQAKPYISVVQGREMNIFGVFAVRPNVDSIALDKKGEYLYYAATTDGNLHRVQTKYLRDESLSPKDLATKTEVFGEKTTSDGITMDNAGNIYISDAEASAIHTLGQDRKMRTLFKHKNLRWPDGFSYGPQGYLYVTCSALHHVIMKSAGHVREHAPYQIYRFKPENIGPPGQ